MSPLIYACALLYSVGHPTLGDLKLDGAHYSKKSTSQQELLHGVLIELQ